MTKSKLSLATVFVASMAATSVVSAAQNPFSMTSLDKGYMVAEADMAKDAKMKDGKCGEGKCGATTDKTKAKAKDVKADVKVEADKAKMKDGKCGEGKCGATKK
jgi:uncharacterized low-complexity protein